MTKHKFLEQFLSAVRGIHVSGAGTKETSYYTAIDNLLDGVGEGLRPKVRCIMQLKNLGAGNPDGGLFAADQCDKKTGDPKDLSAPGRGVTDRRNGATDVRRIGASNRWVKRTSRGGYAGVDFEGFCGVGLPAAAICLGARYDCPSSTRQ